MIRSLCLIHRRLRARKVRISREMGVECVGFMVLIDQAARIMGTSVSDITLRLSLREVIYEYGFLFSAPP